MTWQIFKNYAHHLLPAIGVALIYCISGHTDTKGTFAAFLIVALGGLAHKGLMGYFPLQNKATRKHIHMIELAALQGLIFASTLFLIFQFDPSFRDEGFLKGLGRFAFIAITFGAGIYIQSRFEQKKLRSELQDS